MIFFFGTKTGKTEIKQLTGVACPYCKQTSTLTLAKTSNWFHLFWVKLFKIYSQVIVECSHCKRVYHEDEFSEGMKTSVHDF